jgi:hypothetical protein
VVVDVSLKERAIHSGEKEIVRASLLISFNLIFNCILLTQVPCSCPAYQVKIQTSWHFVFF